MMVSSTIAGVFWKVCDNYGRHIATADYCLFVRVAIGDWREGEMMGSGSYSTIIIIIIILLSLLAIFVIQFISQILNPNMLI